jgi:hypothetical protein
MPRSHTQQICLYIRYSIGRSHTWSGIGQLRNIIRQCRLLEDGLVVARRIDPNLYPIWMIGNGNIHSLPIDEGLKRSFKKRFLR